MQRFPSYKSIFIFSMMKAGYDFLSCRLGLDAKMLAHILNVSSGRCWSSEVYNPVPGVKEGVPSSNDYKGGFGTALMTKVKFSCIYFQPLTLMCKKCSCSLHFSVGNINISILCQFFYFYVWGLIHFLKSEHDQ